MPARQSRRLRERSRKNGRKVPPLPLAKSMAVLGHETWFGHAAETLPRWATEQRAGCGTTLRNHSRTLRRHAVPLWPVFAIQVRHKTRIVAGSESNSFYRPNAICECRRTCLTFLHVSRNAGVRKWSRIFVKFHAATPGESTAPAPP